MKKLILLLLIGFLFSSCLDFQMIKFKGIEDFKMPKMDDKEIHLNLGIKVENPNKFNLKLKPSSVNVFVEDKLMGVVKLDNKVKFKKRSEGIYDTKLRIKLEPGALFSLMKYTTKKEVPVRFKGVIKGAAFGITKRVKIDQSQVVDGSSLKMDKLFKKND